MYYAKLYGELKLPEKVKSNIIYTKVSRWFEISDNGDSMDLVREFSSYHEDEIIDLLNWLSNEGVTGEIYGTGEENSHWRFLITENGVKEQQGRIIYE